MLGGNDLTGLIQIEISEMVELRSLHLGDSQMGGEIPAELYRLENLRVLQLQNANFEGTLSEDFGLLNQTIATISLNGNDFSGDVPRSLDECKYLRKSSTFAVRNCVSPCLFFFLTSVFLFCFFQERLDLSDNPRVTGSISSALCQLRHSRVLKVVHIDCAVACNCCGFRCSCDYSDC
jgi:hypothetical protein